MFGNPANILCSSKNLSQLQPAASDTRQAFLREERNQQQSKSDLAVTPVPYLAV